MPFNDSSAPKNANGAVLRTRTKVSQTILIVDDETDVAEVCARVLKRAGFNCLVAHDSPAAIAMVDSDAPDLVLSDINLPTADGYEIARYVRRKSPATLIILMTTNHNPSVPGDALRAGASGCLSKPFSNTELVTAIRSLLGAAFRP